MAHRISSAKVRRRSIARSPKRNKETSRLTESRRASGRSNARQSEVEGVPDLSPQPLDTDALANDNGILDTSHGDQSKTSPGRNRCSSSNVSFDPSRALSPARQQKIDLGDAASDGRESSLPIRHLSQVWVKVHGFTGQPKRSDFKAFTEELRPLAEGEILVEALCWTVDYYMKIFEVPQNSIMIGEQVGSVIESRNENYPMYMLVVTLAGWRTHTIINPATAFVRKFIDIGDLPASLYLGTLGLPGLCAFFGVMSICQPCGGEVVLVNAAAGSIGNVVGQIAKIRGCRVIAFAGTKARCHWIRELGFDFVFNYSTVGVGAALRRVAPTGVDYYFDCVGAEFTKSALRALRVQSTICMFGYVNSYGQQTPYGQPEHPYRLVSMHNRQISTTSIYDYEPFFDEATGQMLEWMRQGKLKYHEVMYNGFDRLPQALAALDYEDHFGKIIVKSARIHSLLTLPVQY